MKKKLGALLLILVCFTTSKYVVASEYSAEDVQKLTSLLYQVYEISTQRCGINKGFDFVKVYNESQLIEIGMWFVLRSQDKNSVQFVKGGIPIAKPGTNTPITDYTLISIKAVKGVLSYIFGYTLNIPDDANTVIGNIMALNGAFVFTKTDTPSKINGFTINHAELDGFGRLHLTCTASFTDGKKNQNIRATVKEFVYSGGKKMWQIFNVKNSK